MLDILEGKNIINSPNSDKMEPYEVDHMASDIQVYDNPISIKIRRLSEIKNIPIADVFVNGVKMEFNHDIVLVIESKPKVMSKNVLALDFDGYPISKILGNKNSMLLRFAKDNLVIDQFITARYIETYFVYKQNEIHLTVISWKESINKLKSLIREGDSELTIDERQAISLNLDEKLDQSVQDEIFLYRYINYEQLENCQTYRDVFQKLNELENRTKDVNYIKSIDYLSKLVFTKLINRGSS